MNLITEKRLLLQGVHAIGFGKIVAGCKFQTYYPITPATDESEFLESMPEYGIRVVQTEDEIAAIAMATGATLSGVRAATSTSGPGFSLMVEALGWAGINEAPIVVVNYQRAGPSTGMPTKTEQGDLEFVCGAGHGTSPRLVIAPGDHSECFYYTIKTFNYAEKYQMPAIFLADKNLANNTATVRRFDLDKIKIDRGKMLSEEELEKILKEYGKYKRFEFTESGISPRSVIGQRGISWATGDEHDELGHITEESDLRIKMMQKRQQKLITAYKEIPAEDKLSLYGEDNADFTLISWGSTKGAILDAMEDLKNELYGKKINFLQIRLIEPFPTEDVYKILNNGSKKVMVEMNFLSEKHMGIGYKTQLAKRLHACTGTSPDNYIVKYNGRPMTKTELYAGIKKIVDKDKKVVTLEHGV